MEGLLLWRAGHYLLQLEWVETDGREERVGTVLFKSKEKRGRANRERKLELVARHLCDKLET